MKQTSIALLASLVSSAASSAMMPSLVGVAVTVSGCRPTSRSARPGLGPRARVRDLPSADVETLERAAAILEEILEAPRPSRRERLQ